MTALAAASPLHRRSVAPDNSCLFTSFAYLCEGIDGSLALSGAARRLRQVCASDVLADPDPHLRAVLLGHDSVQAYSTWIVDETHWGGEPEILMLGQHFGVEVALVSAECWGLVFLLYNFPFLCCSGCTRFRGDHARDPLPDCRRDEAGVFAVHGTAL